MSSSDYHALLSRAIEKLKAQEPVLELEAARILVVGDTHGYPEVTEWALELAEHLGVEAVLFLGDYVDRGPRGVENLELVLSRLLEDGSPAIYMLRGNHEDLEMNYYYGFYSEALNKRGPDYLNDIAKLYSALPIAARANEVFFVHGGVPCRLCSNSEEDPVRVEEIAREARVLREEGSPSLVESESSLVMQALWNDPRGGIEWFLPSPRGLGIYLYGRSAWRKFLEENRLKVLVRAHETVDGVLVWHSDGGHSDGVSVTLGLDELEYCVISVFSSLYHGRRAAVLLVDIEERVIKPLYYGAK
jgi:protein phosphatase